MLGDFRDLHFWSVRRVPGGYRCTPLGAGHVQRLFSLITICGCPSQAQPASFAASAAAQGQGEAEQQQFLESSVMLMQVGGAGDLAHIFQ